MAIGVIAGYLLRNRKFLQNIEKSTSLTVFLLLFVLGLSIGSNQLIIENIGHFGWQAAVLAGSSLGGSILATRFISQYFLGKEVKNEK